MRCDVVAARWRQARVGRRGWAAGRSDGCAGLWLRAAAGGRAPCRPATYNADEPRGNRACERRRRWWAEEAEGTGRGHAGPASGIPGHLLPGAWGLDEPLGRPRAPGRPSTHRKGNGSGKPKRGDEATNGKPETGNRPPPCQPKAPIVNELWPILTGVDAGGITGGRRRLSAATPSVSLAPGHCTPAGVPASRWRLESAVVVVGHAQTLVERADGIPSGCILLGGGHRWCRPRGGLNHRLPSWIPPGSAPRSPNALPSRATRRATGDG